MLPFELWLNNIDSLHIFKMLCCTNKEVRKYLVILYPNHAAKTHLISLSQPWLPELYPHRADAWRVHTLLQQIKCRLHRMLGNQTLPANPLVVTPRRAGKTELVGTIAAALLLSNRRVVVVATCRRVASNILSEVIQWLELDSSVGNSNFIQHGDGWLQCYAASNCSAIDTADVILMDEAAYTPPEVIEMASTKCTFMISTLTSENNHFSGMCSNPAFNVVEAPTSPWAFLVRWE